MNTQTASPAFVQELREAARRRDALAAAYARRAEHYRAEAAKLRAAAVQVARRLKRGKVPKGE